MPSSSSCCSVISPVQIIFPEPKRNPRPGELSHPQEGSRRSGKHSEQERHPFPPNSLYSTVEEISKVVQHTRAPRKRAAKTAFASTSPAAHSAWAGGFLLCGSLPLVYSPAGRRGNSAQPPQLALPKQGPSPPRVVAFPCPRPPAGLPNCHGSCRRQHSLRTRRG
jgi:hypothetical protein